jgi:hypothetical protein
MMSLQFKCVVMFILLDIFFHAVTLLFIVQIIYRYLTATSRIIDIRMAFLLILNERVIETFCIVIGYVTNNNHIEVYIALTKLFV